MNFITLLLIAVGLSFDSFAVSVSCGLILTDIKFKQALRFSLPLTLFQAFMPVIGWYAGLMIKDYITEIDHWIAFILLSAIGVKMIIESGKPCNERNINPLNVWINLGMALATSIDALIVGISFALIELNIYTAVFTIALITFAAVMLGLFFGKRIGKKFGKKMEFTGGIMLILIGFKILVEHLFLS